MSLGKIVAKNIKKYREETEISQRELGRRIGKTGQYISYLEKEDNPNIGTDMIEDVAEALEIPAKDLLKENNLINGLTASVKIKDTDTYKECLDLIKNILVDDRIDWIIRMEYYERFLKKGEK